MQASRVSPYPRAEASSLQPRPPSGLSGWLGPTLRHSSLQPCSPWPPPGAALLCSPGHEGMTTRAPGGVGWKGPPGYPRWARGPGPARRGRGSPASGAGGEGGQAGPCSEARVVRAAGRARPRGPSAPQVPSRYLESSGSSTPRGMGLAARSPLPGLWPGLDQRDIDEDVSSTVHSPCHRHGDRQQGQESGLRGEDAARQPEGGLEPLPTRLAADVLETKNNCAGGLIFKRRVSCASAQVTQAPHPTAPLQEPEWTRAAWPSMEATLPPSTHHARHPAHPGQQAHAPLPVTPRRPQPGLPALTQAESPHAGHQDAWGSTSPTTSAGTSKLGASTSLLSSGNICAGPSPPGEALWGPWSSEEQGGGQWAGSRGRCQGPSFTQASRPVRPPPHPDPTCPPALETVRPEHSQLPLNRAGWEGLRWAGSAQGQRSKRPWHGQPDVCLAVGGPEMLTALSSGPWMRGSRWSLPGSCEDQAR